MPLANMAVRGVFQLRNVKLQFCDFGGSSRGVRDLLKTTGIEEFLDKNPHIKLDAFMVRGEHPYIRTEYINGWNRTISLRNLSEPEILEVFEEARAVVGHKAWKHAGPKVYTTRPSIQGPWRPNMWANTAAVEEFVQRNPPQPPIMRTPGPKKVKPTTPLRRTRYDRMLSRSSLV